MAKYEKVRTSWSLFGVHFILILCLNVQMMQMVRGETEA